MQCLDLAFSKPTRINRTNLSTKGSNYRLSGTPPDYSPDSVNPICQSAK